jgi:hypothetical protein
VGGVAAGAERAAVSGLSLLVVDWDYFFPNPFDGGDQDDPNAPLYDWSHAESRFYIEMVWPGRAASFLINEVPLPMCQGWETFWDRFSFAEGAPLYIADSNAFAGTIPAGLGYAEAPSEVADWPWGSVWLYDAHHDCGYKTSPEEVRERGTISCEDWMLVHHDAGSALHLRYPPWRTRFERAPAIPIERRTDDGTAPPVVFDAVFLCRSGAWVPPWCDQQFDEFAARYPGGEASLVGPIMTRTFDRELAEHDAEQMRKLRTMMRGQKGRAQQ